MYLNLCILYDTNLTTCFSRDSLIFLAARQQGEKTMSDSKPSSKTVTSCITPSRFTATATRPGFSQKKSSGKWPGNVY